MTTKYMKSFLAITLLYTAILLLISTGCSTKKSIVAPKTTKKQQKTVEKQPQKTTSQSKTLCQNHDHLKRFDYAKSLLDSGKYDEAMKEYKETLKMSDFVEDRAMAYNGMARCLMFQGKIDEARKLLESLDDEKEDVHVNLTFGEIYLETMDYEKALKSYSKVAQKAPLSIESYLGQGIALNRMYKYDKALEAFKKAEELDKSHPDDDHKLTVKTGKAAALFGLKKYDESMKELNELLAQEEQNLSLYQIAFLMNDMEEFIMSVQVYKLLKNRKLKIEDDNAFVKRPRKKSDYYLTVAVLFSDHWEYEKAESLFDIAEKADPENRDVWIERGWNYFRLKKMDKAREHVTKWLDSSPKVREPEDLESFAIAWMIKEDYNKALDYINQAINTDPEWMDFYRRRAEINVLKGDTKAALKDYEYVKKKGLGDAQKDGAKMVDVLKKKIKRRS